MLQCKLKRYWWLDATCIPLLAALSVQAQGGPVEEPPHRAIIAHDAACAIAIGPSRVCHLRQSECEATASLATIRVLPILEGLSLTNVQREQISAILYAQVPALREREKIARLAKLESRRLSNSVRFDRAELGALADAGSRALCDMARLRADAEHRIYTLLTHDQQQQLHKLNRRSGGQPSSDSSATPVAPLQIDRPSARQRVQIKHMETV